MANFYISDLHIGHENILRFDNRPFADVNEMNNKLISRAEAPLLTRRATNRLIKSAFSITNHHLALYDFTAMSKTRKA